MDKGLELKKEGNAFYKAGEYQKAAGRYSQIFLYTNHLSPEVGDIVQGVNKRVKPTGEQTAEINKLRAVANTNAAQCHFNLKNWDKTLDFVERALKVKPDHKKAMLIRGKVLLRQGHLNRAEVDLRIAESHWPKDRNIKREMLLLTKKLKKHEKRQRKHFAGMFDRIRKMDEKDEPNVDKPAEDKPAEDKPAEDKPVEDKPVEDKPAEDKPAEDKSVEDKPVEDKSVEDKSVEDKPAEDKPKPEDEPKQETKKEKKAKDKKKAGGKKKVVSKKTGGKKGGGKKKVKGKAKNKANKPNKPKK